MSIAAMISCISSTPGRHWLHSPSSPSAGFSHGGLHGAGRGACIAINSSFSWLVPHRMPWGGWRVPPRSSALLEEVSGTYFWAPGWGLSVSVTSSSHLFQTGDWNETSRSEGYFGFQTLPFKLHWNPLGAVRDVTGGASGSSHASEGVTGNWNFLPRPAH